MKPMAAGLVAVIAILVLKARAYATDVFSMPGSQTSLQFVTIGDPGNFADTRRMTDGTYGSGGVNYSYQMGRFDITTAQYAAFLNAVAATDPYGLYFVEYGDAYMSPGHFAACGITRNGSSGGFTYSVAPGHENYPVNYVTWLDAARFCNWLTNSQPNTGVEGPATTESGSYSLNGVTGFPGVMAITRNTGAKYVIPTDSEWYKAAYYKGGSTNAGYWLYPTQSDADPSNAILTTGTNNANYFNYGYADPTNYLTPVGTFANSPSHYGTYDQGGDVYQWMENSIGDSYRVLRGGSFYDQAGSSQGYYQDALYLQADYRSANFPINSSASWGFRVALVPEPACLSLLCLGGMGLFLRRPKAHG